MTLSRVLIAEHAAVASEHPLASLAGYDAMRKGGNAFDAAVATSFALAVTMHHIGGLGGDFFGMFYEAKSGKVHCLNSSGWSPSGLTLELVKSSGEPKVPIYGPLSCVVPGQVAGVWAMHRRFGSLEFKDLVQPARAYASEGFPASEGYCRSTAATFDFFSDEARRVFAPGGKAPVPGDRIRQQNLSKVIQEVGDGGADAFYRGWPADRLREALQSLGVPADKSDFGDFKPEWVEPLTLDYRGATVYEVPPNSIGATCVLMLKLLSGTPMGGVGPLSSERIAHTMEAAETAYERKDRMLGDPRFGTIDMGEFMKPQTAKGAYGGVVRDGDTTAFSVADAEGNIVSGIQSLFRHFGSRVYVPETGIVLNDRGSGFSFAGPNKVEPRKRPLHTLSSLIVESGSGSRIAIGSSGGDFRPMQHTLFVSNIVDYKMTLESVVEHPRFLWSEGRSLLVEAGYDEFRSSRYDVQKLPMPGRTGVCHAVGVEGRLRRAVCDVRGDGIPAGF